MRVGVIAELMALGEDSLDQSRTRLGVAADDEKRRLHMFGFEDIEDLRRPLRIGTVIECQCDFLWMVAAELMDHVVRGRDLRGGLVVDIAGLGIDFEIALAARSIVVDPDGFAATLEIKVLARNVAKARGGRRAVWPRHNPPKSRVSPPHR